MSNILSVISDIRVVEAIATLVIILAVWLIIEKVRYSKRIAKQNNIEHRYTGKTK